MAKPDLFDGIELLVDLPEVGIQAGEQGAIVEDYGDAYEIEFFVPNSNGETLALCRLTLDQFVVVWRSATKSDVSISGQVAAIVE
ncbi:DUF4926 domain-containing protein [Cyanobacteria bacterium FACHB-DQ100]|nr:DUF4926 domain-containing protein [Cyanobacteria bacterium FACHB-DQ100]